MRLTQVEQRIMILYLHMRLTQVEQPRLLLIQQPLRILAQLLHLIQVKTQQKVEVPQQRLVPQRHLTLAVLPQHQEVLKNQEIQQRHLTRKHRITHTLILKLVTVDVLEHVYKKYNIYVNITIWQIHHEEQII